MTRESFFAEYWERAPLHVHHGDGGFYRAVLTKADLEGMLSSGVLRHPAVQLSKGGRFYPADSFTRSIRSGADTFSGVVDVARLSAEYHGGATILLPGLQRAHPPVRALTAALEASFNHPVQANVYLTPRNAIGFAPHYDTHEVFILQISGVKHWRIYPPSLPLPYRNQPFTRDSAVPAKELMSLEMEAGDLLYLPRGYIHTTSTSQAASVHLTIGMTVLTWLDLAGELVLAAKEDMRLRQALPMGFASQPDAIPLMRDTVGAIFAQLAQSEQLPAMLEDFARRARINQTICEEFRIDADGAEAPQRRT